MYAVWGRGIHYDTLCGGDPLHYNCTIPLRAPLLPLLYKCNISEYIPAAASTTAADAKPFPVRCNNPLGILLRIYKAIYIPIYIWSICERCVLERTHAYQRVEGEKNSRGFVFLFRFASFPFPVFAITIYKPAPAKTRHSTAPGPEVFAQCQPRTSVRRRTRRRPRFAFVFVFFFFFVILRRLIRVHDGNPAAPTV